MMRLLSFMITVTAIILCIVVIVLVCRTGALVINGVMVPADTSLIRELIWLIGALLMYAFGGKALQKWGERENSIEQRPVMVDEKQRIGFIQKIRSLKFRG